ncbi:Zn-ribbon domain-containing OB-fold protein [Actinomadura alba]|uniref:OB-fold domain-containing protein n=1 Tax=Actinomadura alba TaxID=406431 RepID=A0ABR7LH21_9ACTN|nr:OB-fold domain-containing protein [Actinomadura alba]MBC6464149.1 OB-fold domain-containing protein [Actinomadura alba]
MDHARPLPSPTPLTAPYWDACRRGELLIQHCAGCGRFVHFPEPACPFCGGADLPYDQVSGRGRIHTYSVVHRAFLPGFDTPYVLAWIDLDEGARAFGDVVGCPPEDVRIGSRVRVCFEDLPGFGTVPRWRLLLDPVPPPDP